MLSDGDNHVVMSTVSRILKNASYKLWVIEYRIDKLNLVVKIEQSLMSSSNCTSQWNCSPNCPFEIVNVRNNLANIILQTGWCTKSHHYFIWRNVKRTIIHAVTLMLMSFHPRGILLVRQFCIDVQYCALYWAFNTAISALYFWAAHIHLRTKDDSSMRCSITALAPLS